MLKWCPNCSDEVEIKHGICAECGEEFVTPERKVKRDTWEEEDVWTESDWGQDTTVEGGE